MDKLVWVVVFVLVYSAHAQKMRNLIILINTCSWNN